MTIVPLSARPVRAALYHRVSGAGQRDNYSIPTQEEACRAYCAERGYVVSEAHVYREVNSGFSLRGRPQLMALREAIARREIDVVVVHDPDRFSREQTHQAVLLYECDDNGLSLEFVLVQFDNSATGKFMRAARAFVAEVEREKTMERTTRGRHARLRAGKISASRRKYGYEFNGDRTAYLPHPEEAPVVARMFSLYAGGATLGAIARTFIAEGLLTAGGTPRWRAANIRALLIEPMYAGRGVGNRRKAVHEKGTGKVRLVERDPSEHIALPEGVIPALVDPAVFDVVQKRLAKGRAESRRNNRHPEATLLRSGFIRCGDCGGAMTAMQRPRAQGVSWYYRCSRNVYCPAGARQIAAEEIDGVVWSRITNVLTHPESVGAAITSLIADDPTPAEQAELDRKITELDRQAENGARALLQLPEAASKPIVAELERLATARATLVEEREALIGRAAEWAEAQTRLAEIEQWCARVGQHLDHANYEQRRELLNAFNVTVSVFRQDAAERYVIEAHPTFSDSINQSINTQHAVTLRWSSNDAAA